MSKKRFNGKAIYNPSGKAGEYSYWACNFYTGCSNNCDYCYCKRGVMSNVWSETPKLKSCFRGKGHALTIFQEELLKNLDEVRKNGIFFSFTTDPCLPITLPCTLGSLNICLHHSVPVKILTKCTDWVDDFLEYKSDESIRDLVAIGFTLTGHNELEPGASTNKERIEAMRKLHETGLKTFASIEPIVDLESSFSMIKSTIGFCDLYKIGLMSGKKYDWRDLRGFMLACTPLESKFYFKDSFINQASMDRDNLPNNCVGRDYNIFNTKEK